MNGATSIMTGGLAEPVPPVLVLGLGNSLLGDDGAGLRLLEELRGTGGWPESIEWVDGGTRGIALLGVLSLRHTAILLDAVQLGAPPGTVHVLGMDRLRRFAGVGVGATPHESNALQLLATAELTGDLPEHVVVVGIEPEFVRTHLGLSPVAEAALPRAMEVVREMLTSWR